MEVLEATSWLDLMAVLAIALGLSLVVWALRLQALGYRPAPAGPRKALNLVRSFRGVLVGLALTGVGVGVLAELEWLVVLSLIIGGQELLETSIMVAALRDEEKRRAVERSTSATVVGHAV